MEKKNLGVLIAGVSLVGAFSVKLYSQYKLLKKDEVEKDELSESVDEKDKVSDLEINEFNVNDILKENDTISDKAEDTEAIDNAVVEKMLEDVIVKINSREQSKDVPINNTLDTTSNVVDIKTDSVDTSNLDQKTKNPDYKNMDVNDPNYWIHFDSEISKEDKEDNKDK